MSHGRKDFAAVGGQQGGVAFEVENVGELHELQKPFRFLLGQSGGPFDPIGKGDDSARLDQPHRFGDELRLIDHVAPGVFAPDEIGLGVGQAGVAGVAEREADPAVESFGFAAAAAALDDGFGGIDAVHFGDISEADEKPHARPVAAAKIDAATCPAPMPAVLGQVHRGGEAADVNLLAHHQFPQDRLPGRRKPLERRSD